MKHPSSLQAPRGGYWAPQVRRLSVGVAAAWLLVACGGGEPGQDELRGASAIGQQVPGKRALAVRDDKLAVGLAQEPYESEVAGLGGVAPYRYAVVEGRLPDGLTLDPDSGAIRGRPAQAGVGGFTVEVRDSAGRTARQAYELYVVESGGTASDAPGQGVGQRARTALGTSSTAGATTTSSTDISGLLGAVAAMPEGSWLRVNLNAYSDVWTPANLRPLYLKSNPTPDRIISSWSGFAWDTRRASLFLYGGGHANYRGNDTYLWRAETRRWERGSLPSEMVQTPLGYFNAIDGFDKAPASAHTYDNTAYLPVIDRFLVLGGAADPNGSHYLMQPTPTTKRSTGPYLFDPSRAHPDRVGGTTGSHVQRVQPYPDIVGGNMWSNRESWLNASAASTPPTESLSNGCTDVVQEGGKDVVYFRSVSRVYRYEIGNLEDPTQDRWTQVGRFFYAGSGDQAACAYDPGRKFFVSTLNRTTHPFLFWDLNQAAPGNRDIMVAPADPEGTLMPLVASGQIRIRQCGFDRDPVRDNYRLWCGDGRVWTLTGPDTPTSTGWQVRLETPPAGGVPSEGVGTGILGKWKYIPNLDVFMGLADPVQGNIWLYKPVGWVNPDSDPNQAPTASIASPSNGAQFLQGEEIEIVANAADSDGTVARVEYLAGADLLGTTTAAPHTFTWRDAPVGVHELRVRAVDDLGKATTAPSVTVTVTAPPAENVPPVASWVAPADGAEVSEGNLVQLHVEAADVDGAIQAVEFFVDGVRVGEVRASPYRFGWIAAALGSRVLTAVAIDDDGARTEAGVRTLQVVPRATGGASVVLQRGLEGTGAVADTYLSSYHQTLGFGAQTTTYDQWQRYSTLVRFAIFQSEGGPVPDGATITSATLSMHKSTAYSMTYEVRRVLGNWSESGATWLLRMPGVAWATPGANGIGTDISATVAASATVGWDPGWMDFDVTDSVRYISAAPAALNFGWRVIGTGGYLSAGKRFYSSEFAGDPALRPKLVVRYE